MPIFDFECEECGKSFEEVCSGGSSVICPSCGSHKVRKAISMPSPLKKGAFPYKPVPGRVHPAASRMACGSGCGSCAQSGE